MGMKLDFKVVLTAAFVLTFALMFAFYDDIYLFFVGPIAAFDYTMDGNGVAKVRWETRFPAKTRLAYGTSWDVLNYTEEAADFTTKHGTDFVGMLPGTNRVFGVIAYDEQGKVYSTLPFR